jgi:helix-turn-helix protein
VDNDKIVLVKVVMGWVSGKNKFIFLFLFLGDVL